MIKAAQSTLGRTLYIKSGFASMVSDTSSQSLGCSGNEALLDLQALMAQVRKFRVRTFISASARGCGFGGRRMCYGVEVVVWRFGKIFGGVGREEIRFDSALRWGT